MRKLFLLFFWSALYFVGTVQGQNYIEKKKLIFQNEATGWEDHFEATDGSLWFFRAHESNSNMFYAKNYPYTKKKHTMVYTKRFRQYVMEVDCATTMFRTLNGTKYVNGKGSAILNHEYYFSTKKFPSDWDLASYGTIVHDYVKKYCSQHGTKRVISPQMSSSEDLTPNGTGFLLSSRYFVTNYHVVSEWSKIAITIDGVSHKAKLKLSDQSNDLAILEIQDPSKVKSQDIPYGIQDNVRTGEKIFVLGYPLSSSMGQEIKIADGIVNSQSGFQGNATQLQVSVAVQPGNSGSPLFNSYGNIIGVMTSGLNRATTENVSYAKKSVYLKALIDSLDDEIVLQNQHSKKYDDLSIAVADFQKYIGIVSVK